MVYLTIPTFTFKFIVIVENVEGLITVTAQCRTDHHTLNVVSISQASELLLTSCVPHVVLDGSSVGVEHQWVHLYSESS